VPDLNDLTADLDEGMQPAMRLVHLTNAMLTELRNVIIRYSWENHLTDATVIGTLDALKYEFLLKMRERG